MTERFENRSSSAADGVAGNVARGGAWNMCAQGVAILTAFVSTPFVIRLLGTENYGVLTLINLLIGYFGFADLGMGIASTKFGAEALSRNDRRGESAVVWTSLLVAAVPALALAGVLVFAGGPLLGGILGLSLEKQAEAIPSLRIAAIILLAASFSGVIDTPQLVRLKIGVTSGIQMFGNIGQASLVLLALWAGARLGGVVTAMAVMALLTAGIHAAVAARLLPDLLRPAVERRLLRPLFRFGATIVGAAALGTIVVHGEKFLLVRFASVSMLAYYGVAVTLASPLGIFPAAIAVPLMPGFVRLRASNARDEFQNLCNSLLRALIFGMAPVALILCVIASTFFSFWAGPDFAKVSTVPLYILVIGWLFHSASYIPRTVLTSWDQVAVMPRYQVFEVVPYFILTIVLIRQFGIAGAAVAWSARVMTECFLSFRAARRLADMRPSIIQGRRVLFVLALATLVVPVILAGTLSPSRWIVFGVAAVSIVGYGFLIFVFLLQKDEKAWMGRVLRSFIRGEADQNRESPNGCP